MILRRLFTLLKRSRLRGEIDEEIRLHLEMRTAEYESMGMSRADARRRARERFGEVGAIRRRVQRIRRVESTTDRGGWTGMWHDVRFAIRAFAKQPTFTGFAVLTLALGVGANTAMYSLVDSVILHPLPFADSDRLAWLWQQRDGSMMIPPSLALSREWSRAEQLDGLINLGGSEMGLRGGEGVSAVQVARVSPEILSFLGIEPVVGRGFDAADSASGAPAVVMLGERFWKSRYGADRAVVGRTVTIDDTPHEVVGVAPVSLDALFRREERQLWVPFQGRDSTYGVVTLVRTSPGAAFEAVEAELGVLREGIDTDEEWKPHLVQPYQMVPRQLRVGLWVLLGSVGCVLLIVCVNIANMLMARGVARQHEIAVRTALGAGRGRIARQLLVESLVLSLVAASIGCLVGAGLLEVVQRLVPATLVELTHARLSLGVLTVGMILGAGAGLLFSLAPILQSFGDSVSESLRRGRSSTSGRLGPQFREALVSLEVALACVLFLGAGLMLRSFANLSSIDPGFDAEKLVSVRVDLPGNRYASLVSRQDFVRDVLDRLAQIPLVARATVAWGVPPRSGVMLGDVEVRGRGKLAPKAGVVSVNWVRPEYFETLGIAFTEGRTFRSNPDRPTAVINERFAREMWPEGGALGKAFRFHDQDDWMTVVGIVESVRANGLADDPERAQVYQPYDAEHVFSSGVILARAAGEPRDIVGLVRGQVSAVDPALPILEATTIAHLYADTISRPRFNAMLLAAFAGLALLLAVAGVYGVIALTMNQRVREIGVRMALGAAPADVRMLTLRWGLRPVVLGTLVGVLGALVLGRVMETLLYDVSPTDPVTFGLVVLILIGSGTAATMVPARRASRADPARILQYE